MLVGAVRPALQSDPQSKAGGASQYLSSGSNSDVANSCSDSDTRKSPVGSDDHALIAHGARRVGASGG